MRKDGLASFLSLSGHKIWSLVWSHQHIDSALRIEARLPSVEKAYYAVRKRDSKEHHHSFCRFGRLSQEHPPNKGRVSLEPLFESVPGPIMISTRPN